MSKSVSELPLSRNRLGTRRTLAVHRYGSPGARPKVYIQAGLHANEVPGMLVARHLLDRLDAADAAGAIQGEIVVVPIANPIGLEQFVLGEAVGRFALDGSGNFNRDFPDLTEAAAERLQGRLGAEAAANVPLVREALKAALAGIEPETPVAALRHALLGLAIDADVVLDLHCDSESLMHLYTGTELWPGAADLAAQLGARAVFLAEVSGGDPFDEACSAVWWKLRDRLGLGRDALGAACLATTVELRGRSDVSDELAREDSDNLFRFLVRRGVISGQAGPLPPARCEATPLAGVERIVAPLSGVVAYKAEIGDLVEPGTVVAEIVDPAAEHGDRARTPLRATTGGLFWSRSTRRVVAAGDIVGSTASPAPLPGRGPKLLTAR
ncbi:succinylglutamate desuccinylase/aspartoacylase family protein [Arenibaculum pallidiluteum]|uniref:succinylglutamate desuccinylase/aspartoacylase family protein n=1 Tax=Arenibaculum pallidiluteum TaxID=2812559 RepID=UPI001A966556|nr:succinylglutamate desuccinylase/aspartoacylase family protein [Arenibaculum pallidiluteum]